MVFKIPNIPTLSRSVDTEVRRAFDSLRSWLENVRGDGGIVTANSMPTDLVTLNDPALAGFFDGSIPPMITGFTVTGAFRTILLAWDDPMYKWFDHVEIWRSIVDNLGTAQMIGTTVSNMYSDLPPDASLSVTYYYWVRIISQSQVAGAYNATAGTPGHTANDPAYMIDLLSKSLDAMTPSTVFGTTDIVIPAANFAIRGLEAGEPTAGTYPFIVARTPMAGDPPGGPFTGAYAVFMNTAYIADGTITNAKIGTLGVDKLVAGGTGLNGSLIADATITNAKIGNTITSTDGVTWSINKNGGIDARSITIRNADGTILLQSGGMLAYSKITGGPPANADATNYTDTRIANSVAATDAQTRATAAQLAAEANARVDAQTRASAAQSAAYNAVVNQQGPFATLVGGITASNAPTYLNGACIGNAYIANAAVDTLKIAGDSIWVPRLSDYSGFTLNKSSLQNVMSFGSTASANFLGGKVMLCVSGYITFTGLTLPSNSQPVPFVFSLMRSDGYVVQSVQYSAAMSYVYNDYESPDFTIGYYGNNWILDPNLLPNTNVYYYYKITIPADFLGTYANITMQVSGGQIVIMGGKR